MHPGGVRSAMDLFDFQKSANLKHPSRHASPAKILSYNMNYKGTDLTNWGGLLYTRYWHST